MTAHPRWLTKDDIKDFKTPEQIRELVQPMIKTEFAKYDHLLQTHRAELTGKLDGIMQRLEKQDIESLKLYGNGSGKPGYLERARAEDKARQDKAEQAQLEVEKKVAALVTKQDDTGQKLANFLQLQEMERVRSEERSRIVRHIKGYVKYVATLVTGTGAIVGYRWVLRVVDTLHHLSQTHH